MSGKPPYILMFPWVLLFRTSLTSVSRAALRLGGVCVESGLCAHGVCFHVCCWWWCGRGQRARGGGAVSLLLSATPLKPASCHVTTKRGKAGRFVFKQGVDFLLFYLVISLFIILSNLSPRAQDSITGTSVVPSGCSLNAIGAISTVCPRVPMTTGVCVCVCVCVVCVC